jgi:hypothetical protein
VCFLFPFSGFLSSGSELSFVCGSELSGWGCGGEFSLALVILQLCFLFSRLTKIQQRCLMVAYRDSGNSVAAFGGKKPPHPYIVSCVRLHGNHMEVCNCC